MKEKFLRELNELLKKYDVESMHGWDTGEVIIALKDEKDTVVVSYNFDSIESYDCRRITRKIEKLEVWE